MMMMVMMMTMVCDGFSGSLLVGRMRKSSINDFYDGNGVI
jgi:hypothetical protein